MKKAETPKINANYYSAVNILKEQYLIIQSTILFYRTYNIAIFLVFNMLGLISLSAQQADILSSEVIDIDSGFESCADNYLNEKLSDKAETGIIWWGCSFVEIRTPRVTVLIDPYGQFSRPADVILVTHEHSDHCHVPTLHESIAASGGTLDLLIGSRECRTCFEQLEGVKISILAGRGETFPYNDLLIETVPSYEGLQDIGYIIHRKDNIPGIMHLGDNRIYTEEFREFAGQVDWLFLSMGKMPFEDMVSLVGDVAPKYLVPIHYRPSEGDILEARYTFPFPSRQKSYFQHLFPDSDMLEAYIQRLTDEQAPSEPEAYIQRLKDNLKAAGVATQMVILKPGRKTGFDFLPEPE